MAGFLKNFKNITRPFVDDDDFIEGDEEYAEEEEEVYEEEEPREAPRSAGFGSRSAKQRDSYREPEEPRRAPAPKASRPEVHTFAPSSFSEVSDLAKFLLEKSAFIINLEETDEATAERLIDFMSGATFALSGRIVRIAKQVYAFSPAGVEFVGFSFDDNVSDDDFYI